jgi:hypothetical protein
MTRYGKRCLSPIVHGDNYLEGGTGQDIYVFNKGDGVDTDYLDGRYTAFNAIRLCDTRIQTAMIRESSNQSVWEVAA